MTKFYMQYLFLFIGIGSFYPYLSVYLEKTLNFTASQIGIIVSIPSLLGILMLPVWGIISDLTKKQKNIICINLFCAIVFMIAYSKASSFVAVFILMTLVDIFKCSLLPLTDSICTIYCHKNNKNYGAVRAAGSAGFAIAAFSVGQIIKFTGSDFISFYGFVISLGICLFIVPFLKTTNIEENKNKMNIKKDLPNLIKNKGFVLILAMCVCVLSLAEGVGAYQGIHLMNMGAGKDLVGMLTLFMVTPELFFMMKSKGFLEKYGYIKLISISSLSLLLRWAVYITTNNIWVFILAASLHGMAISMMTICAFDFIKKVVPSNLASTSITVYSFTIGMGSAIMKLIYGNLIDSYGMNFIFGCSIAISLMGLGIIVLLNRYISSREYMEVGVAS
ncbi:MFS transporter [Romboutsia weinsteinii]|uniref:MFS transporter n=1 Tax=Romboutsia weinsteinii TaxID=2020949 RepID=A0A371J2I7_9FIRM|nr:MFS transporter [Romboutsia weinsteinii]RDY26990.1 MFS transporter [Romboutsia weinsteinii]